MIDPGNNAWTRWLDGLKVGDPVQHEDGRIGSFRHDYILALVVEIDGKIEQWSVDRCDQPPHPDLIALAARLPEDL